MKQYLVCLLIFILSCPIHAQDNLKRMPDSQNVNTYALIDSAKAQVNQPQKSFDLIEKALVQSIQNKNVLGEGLSYQVLGMINVNLGQHDLAIDYYQKAITIFTRLKRNDHLNQTYGLLGDAYFALGDDMNSYNSYEKYLKTAPHPSISTQAKYKLAVVHEKNGRYNEALKLINQVLAHEQEVNNKQGIIDAQNRLGGIYSHLNQNDQAIANYQQSAKIAGEISDKKALTNTLREQSSTLRKSRRFDEELQIRHELLDISEENRDLPAQIIENREIGAIYIEQKESEKAIPYIQKSIELSGTAGILEEKGKGLQTLSLAYKEQMAYDLALETYKEFVETTDELHRIKEAEIKNSMLITTSLNRKLDRLDLIEKELQLSNRTVELLKQEQQVDKKTLKAQQMLTYSLTSALVIMLIASGFVYRSGNQKRKANQTLALRSLRSQMNPHFIYNSLNSVNNHISRKDEKAANKFLADFSRLMRAVMENSKHDFVPLSSEIEILKLYLFLEHSRFNDKFDYTFEIDPDIDTDAYQIPPMLVQPFIENAIWHGLRYRDTKGILTVSIIKKTEMIEVIITDNGIGRKKSQELKTKNQKEHQSTGLLNIRNRIDLINELFHIKLEVNIEDQDQTDQSGTIVKIRIPGKA